MRGSSTREALLPGHIRMNSFLSSDPELAFVVSASAPAARPLSGDQVRNWSRVVELSLHHRVYPRVWQNAAPHFPDAVAQIMRDHARRNAHNALRNLARTIETVELLRRVDIEPIVLKGPLLAQQLYGNAALRVSGDIDLLIDAADLQRAAETLSRAGFEHHTHLANASLARHRKSQHDIAFAHPEDNALVELHGDIAQPHYGYQFDLAAWRGAACPVKVGRTLLSVLNPAHGYLLCALHAAKHRWHRLDLITDIAAFMESGHNATNMGLEASQSWMLKLMRTGEELAAAFYGGGSVPLGLPAEIASKVVTGTEFGRWDGMWLDVRLRSKPPIQGGYLLKRLLSARSLLSVISAMTAGS
jgi:hypothetical protein